VFFPTNVGENHWILVIYDTFNKKILGLDSLGSAVNNILMKLYEYLTVEFFYLYREKDEEKKERQLKKDYVLAMNERKPTLIQKFDIDQQKDDINCGVFVCWFMYCLCYSLPLQTPILPNFREEILTKVFTNNLELSYSKQDFNIIKQWKEKDIIDLTGDDDFEIVEPGSKKKHGSKKKISIDGRRKKKKSNKKKKNKYS
jgi:Ulp1 family protease